MRQPGFATQLSTRPMPSLATRQTLPLGAIEKSTLTRVSDSCFGAAMDGWRFSSAANCLPLSANPIVAMTRLHVHCDFADAALLKARLVELGAGIEGEDFASHGVGLCLRVPTTRLDDAQARIIAISRGRSVVKLLD